jgi:tetratricopeptide (TPR) repeat protein
MHDTTRLKLLADLTNAAPDGEWQVYNLQMKKLAEKKLAENTADRKIIKTYLYFLAEATHNQGVDLTKKTEWNRASIAYNRSIYISKQIGDKSGAAYTMVELAKAYHGMSDNSKAIEVLFEALKILEELKDQEGTGDIYTEMANIYLELQNSEKALEYAQKSFDIQEKAGNEYGMYEALTRLGLVYLSEKKYQQSVACFDKGSLLIDSMPGDIKYEIFKNKGLAYLGQKKYDEAIRNFHKSLAAAQAGSIKGWIVTDYFLLCNAYTQKKEYPKAIMYGEKAMSLNREAQSMQVAYKGAEYLYIAYKESGNYTKALEMFELSNRYRDSIDFQKTQKKMLEQQLRYDYSKKELITKNENDRKISTLRLVNEKKQTRKNAWMLGLISLSLLFLLISVFLYNFFRQKNVIANQKANILKQKLLVSQMNPHFIFNSLNAIQNYIFKQDSLKAGIYLSQFAELIRMILDYSRRDLISLDEEIKLLTNYFGLQQLRFEHKFDYSITVSEEIDTESVQIPPMLAQPFIENAIEHGIFYKEGKGMVKVMISKNKDKLVYEIEDDGVGLERSLELNRATKSLHKSLATIITKERIESIKFPGAPENAIEVIDLGKNSPGGSGVKVTFAIPFTEMV